MIMNVTRIYLDWHHRGCGGMFMATKFSMSKYGKKYEIGVEEVRCGMCAKVFKIDDDFKFMDEFTTFERMGEE